MAKTFPRRDFLKTPAAAPLAGAVLPRLSGEPAPLA
ncbi:MAG: twin-arginine translocation signal domain-containing protein, partial [Acidobacteria bacterium]|nr:twin-arginine translocation signal domain-containing protein [Acidobacteriota bacterium]